MSCEPVIFIHSSFRTGSTWFQSRFRRSDGFCTFTEAYNEQLASLTLAEVYRACYEGWTSRHPPSIPYFAEFAGLLRPEGGVEGFKPAFSFERYFPEDPGHLPDDERAYLQGLIDSARRHGRIPVITFTRSLGRVAAIRAALGGFHILTYRNLFNQWCSYTQFAASGASYFLNTTDWIIAAARDTRLRAFAAVFGKGRPSAADAATFLRFVLLHLYLYGSAAAACDAQVWMEDLAVDEIRSGLEARLREVTGRAVDLTGHAETRQFSYIDLDPAVLQEAMAVFPGLPPPDGDAGRVVQRCREALLASFTRYMAEAPALLASHRALYARTLTLEQALAERAAPPPATETKGA